MNRVMLFIVLVLGLFLPLKVNAITATPTPKNYLVQFSFRVNKTETYGKLKYKIDFFADTGDESIPISYLFAIFKYSSVLSMVNNKFEDRDCRIETRIDEHSYDNTKTAEVYGNCDGKGGKLHVLSFVLEPNIFDKVEHLLFFDPQKAIVSLYGGGKADFRTEWVSGYGNYMVLSDFPFGSGCSDAKKMGDYNNDGEVDGLDYSYWKQEFVDKMQHDGKWEASHVCGDEVTSEDYSVWRYNYY